MKHDEQDDLEIISIESEKFNPKSVLVNPTKDVEFPLSKQNVALINAMKAKLLKLEGVGLAAPQVNVQKSILAIYIPKSASLLRDNAKIYPVHVLINPKYWPADDKMVSDFEACYSVESKMGKVPRYQSIVLNYQDIEGHFVEEVVTGFYARVVQHEIDHLNGLLITDRLTSTCVQGNHTDMLKLRRQELPDDRKILFDDLINKKNIKK